MGTQRQEHQNQRTSHERATADVDDEHGEVKRFEESFSSSSSFCAPQRSSPCKLGVAPPTQPCVAAQTRRARHGAPAEPHPTPSPPPFAPATRAGGGRRPAGRRAPHRRRGATTAGAQEQPASAEGKHGRSWPCGSGSVRTPGRTPELAVSSARRPQCVTRPPITAVMKGGSQLHLPLMPQHGAQPSLPPPFGGTCAINIHVDSQSFATSYTKKSNS